MFFAFKTKPSREIALEKDYGYKKLLRILCTKYASLVLWKALLHALPKYIMYKYNQWISNAVKSKTAHHLSKMLMQTSLIPAARISQIPTSKRNW